MKILIIDDSENFAKQLEHKLRIYLSEYFSSIDINIISNNFDTFNYYDEYNFIFLDIDLRQSSGFEIAVNIKANFPSIDIIFVSGKNNLIHSSMLLQPLFFIRKSNLEEDIIHLCMLINNQIIDNISLELNYNYVKSYIQISNIIYIESRQHVLYVNTKNKIYKDNRSLKEMLSLLNHLNFSQIHKSYIINFDYLTSYKKNNYIELTGNIKLTIGRAFKDSFDENYRKYLIK